MEKWQKWYDLARGARGVVFDFGGVISFAPAGESPVYAAAAELGLSRAAYDEGFRRHRSEWDGGFVTGVEMYRRIFAENGLAATEDQYRHLLDVDCEGWIHTLNPDTLALMRRLKADGFRLGILTNMSREFKDNWFVPRAAAYLALADAVVVSGEHRLFKPEPAIYALMEREIGLSGRDLIFFDDNLPNVEGARRVGWRAELFRP